MNECPRADVRDVLPDLVNNRLDPRTRAEVEQHIATCSDCAREVELLRGIRPLLARTPAVDVARIAGAVQASGSANARVATRTRAMRTSWMRLAAAITLLLGGATALVLWSRVQDAIAPRGTAVAPEPAPGSESLATPSMQPTPAPLRDVPIPPSSEAPRLAANDGIVFGGGVGDLAEADLEELLSDLDRLDALTDVEPQPVLLDMEDGL